MITESAAIASSERSHQPSLVQIIQQLAREASIELNVPDVRHLHASRALLRPGKRIYVSHLPKQTWKETEAACCAVREAGFDPIPHVPVRLIEDAAMLNRVLEGFIRHAKVNEVLLLSGDYPHAVGPYSSVLDVFHAGVLENHELTRVSLAGHPEGHPKVPMEEVRRAEIEKARFAREAGVDVTLVTQFFFEHAPFVAWVKELRARGVRARMVGGLAGPASLATLFKFAMRCGAGPSIRALGARPTSFMKLIGDHGPEQVLRGVAEAREHHVADFTGVHLFCFGGFLRTCEWLHRVVNGEIALDQHSFRVVNEGSAQRVPSNALCAPDHD